MMRVQAVPRANHPGHFLLTCIQNKKISQRKFAELIGKTHVEVNSIINGKKDINSDFAIRFGIALGVKAELRLGMQKNYDLYKASQSEKKDEYKLVTERVRELALA